ncbi:unnamed protein product [Cladocopium goreaui]|uniref:Phospho-2-dehydro-3-deoxyheptonate aldolase n=1 Tax=Cladocopium goreaui TaxID=2562237 RepID=A0A9P1DMV4_9DINO|nr:unnamed protein product [Cladocopium goreaui]
MASPPHRLFQPLLLLLLLWSPCSVPRSGVVRTGGLLAAPASAAVKPRTLKYGTLADQVGDLWLPEDPEALVVLIHGGFWLPQYGKDLMSKLASDVVSRRWACWNLEYRRVAGPGWKDFNSTLQDITAALHFLKSPDFPQGLPVALVGHSAGGHLALWSQLSPGASPEPCAVISAGGVLDLCYADEEALGGGAGAVARFLGYRDVSSLKREVSPIDMLPPCRVNSLPPEEASRGTVPRARIGLVHGKRDDVVPPEQSVRFLVSSTCARVPCELHMALDEGHYEVLDPKSVSWRAVISMVKESLAAPRVAQAVPLQTQREEQGDEWIFRSRPVS